MNIYVGNLSFDATEEDLRQAFDPYGEISSVRVITDRDSGRSKGFGFVEMANDTEAQSAISGLNGKELQGRTLKVDEARPRSEGRRDGRGQF